MTAKECHEKEMDRLWTKLAEKNAQIDVLGRICGECYQVIATLAMEAGRWNDDAVTRALDNSSRQVLQHDDVLPFEHIPTRLEKREIAAEKRNKKRGKGR